MEKIGLTASYLDRLHSNWVAHDILSKSKEQDAYSESLKEALAVLKNIAKQKDISLLLGTEQATLTQEIELYANSAEETNSIRSALNQVAEAHKSLTIVQDSKAYQAATATYSGKRKDAGLPLDSFREFIKSHTTRLTNRLAAPLPVPEKNLLRQRKENMRVAKELYIDLQRKALDIPAPSKDIGLER